MSLFLRPSRHDALKLRVAEEIENSLHEWIAAFRQAQARNLDLQRQLDETTARHAAQLEDALRRTERLRSLIQEAGTFFTSEQRAGLLAEASRLSERLAACDNADRPQISPSGQRGAWSDLEESTTAH